MPTSNKRNNHMRLAVILSMKCGLEHFIYREMCQLSARGVSVDLFPTKQGSGLYGPRSDWGYRPWRGWQVLLSQPARFLARPIQYVLLLCDAIRHRTVVD